MKKIAILSFIIAMIAGVSVINPAEASEENYKGMNVLVDNNPDNDEDEKCCKEDDEKEGECCDHDHKEGESKKEAECNHSHEHSSKEHKQKEDCESKAPCSKEEETGKEKNK
ncbi:MAG: hypothetical protein ACOCPM_05025 [Bacteroidales bacterium]